MRIEDLFELPVEINDNYISRSEDSHFLNQNQTNDVFSSKWTKVEEKDNLDELEKFQFSWYLNLYDFENIESLKSFLNGKRIIFDAGCGLGYKAAWFAELSPRSIVLAMDFSNAVEIAARKYRHLKNLYFIKGDIADTGFKPGVIDYVSCDQVIMHTEKPDETFRHLSEVLSKHGQFACYVYAKKALPRELLDDYFRLKTHEIPENELWEMSKQLTQLGKNLSELNVKVEVPDIPLLGIKKGNYDVQRFMYWNFLKRFWNEKWGEELCNSTNFDWYSPSNAKRYSEKEFYEMVYANNLKIETFHSEEACYSRRFVKS